jgi:Protein of unknown function (DUF1336).
MTKLETDKVMIANSTKKVQQHGSIRKLFQSCSFGSVLEVESNDDGYDDESKIEELLNIETVHRSGIVSLSANNVKSVARPLLPTYPSPLAEKYWTEPSAASFSVRGLSYAKDRLKVKSEPSLFRLFAVDLVRVDQPILKGMCNHPEERVQQCLKAEKAKRPGAEMPPFVFCVNITVPGKNCYHLVMYYAVDDFALVRPIERGEQEVSPFRELASRFFFGTSDEFRDLTFKLIPRIVKGNFLVKKAVGSKPTILGKRLKQHYVRNERFFELIIDVGSNEIAKSVVGLSCGYVSLYCTIQSVCSDVPLLFSTIWCAWISCFDHLLL